MWYAGVIITVAIFALVTGFQTTSMHAFACSNGQAGGLTFMCPLWTWMVESVTHYLVGFVLTVIIVGGITIGAGFVIYSIKPK